MKNWSYNKKICKLVIAFMLMGPTIALAEYRVYQYYVKSRLNNKRDQNTHLVTSTLDPVSYLSYHGGRSSIKIDLLRTWMCPGFTGMFAKFCDGPLETLTKRQALVEN